MTHTTSLYISFNFAYACIHTGLAEEKPQVEVDNEGEEEHTEPVEVPETFLLAEAGDHNKALARYLDTQKWRREIGADTALATPHPKFDICKVCSVVSILVQNSL
jgi:hypothetical protein